jgi:molybdopterin converting factor subunit 1
MHLIYFAWIREIIGRSEETMDPPDEVTNVAHLLTWLSGRGAEYAAALSNTELIRVAVNQEFAEPDTKIKKGDEVALFPPVTGG